MPDIKVRLSPQGVQEVVAALRTVRQEAEKTAATGTFGKLASGAADALSPLNALKAALPALGLTAFLAGVHSVTLGVTEFADNAGKAAQRIGTTAESFSTLAFGATTADVGMEEMEKTLGRTAKKVSELKQGNTAAADTFAELGLSAADFAGKDTAQSFELIAQRIVKVADGGDRVRLAMDIMGKAGARLLPLMKDVAEKGLGGLGEEAKKFGAFVTTEFATAAEQFDDNLKRIEVSSHSLSRQMIAGVLPGLNEITGAMNQAASEGSFFKAVLVGLGGLIDNVFNGSQFQQAKKRVQDLEDQIKSLDNQIVTGKKRSFFGLFNTDAGDKTKLAAQVEERKQQLAQAQKEFAELTKPKTSKEAPGSGIDSDAPVQTAQRIADLTKRLKLDEIKTAEDAAAKQRAIREAEIKTELDLAAARLAGSTNQIAAQGRLDAAITASINARSQLAKEGYVSEIDAIKTREVALLASLDKERAATAAAGASTKQLDETVTVVQRQSLDQRLAIAQGYYQKLLGLQSEHALRYKQATEAIKTIDKEVATNRLQTEQSFEQIRISKLSAEEQQGARIRAARETEAKLQDAVLTGQLDKARQLRNEMVALGTDVARSAKDGDGFTFVGKQIAERANELLELALNKDKAAKVATQVAEAGALKDLGAQVKDLNDQIQTLLQQRLSAVDVPLTVSPENINALVDSIRAQLAQQKFSIEVTPNVGGAGSGSAPGFASGGKIPGSSPHPRADDKIVRMTAGEWAMPVSSVRKYGDGFMESVRNGSLPKFADGGRIGGGTGPAGAVHALDISINKRSIGRVAGSRETIAALTEMLQDVERGTQ